MMPPYTYAAGRTAEERREDAIRRNEQARLMHTASPVRRGATHRLMARSGRPSGLTGAGGQTRASAVRPAGLA
jgi:hypothetical protein